METSPMNCTPHLAVSGRPVAPRLILSAAALLLMCALWGCAKSGPAAEPPIDAAPVTTVSALEAEVRALREQTGSLSQTLSLLPAHTEGEDRILLADALDQTAQTLGLLRGPYQPTGAGRQRLALIREAADRLRRAGLDVRVEPSTNIALQSIHDDLADVQRDRFRGNQEIGDQIGQLATRVGDIDRLSGPLHQLMTVQTLELACQTMTHMTQVLDQQAQAQASRASAPAH
jgi:predicted small lipoprotein YifL